MRYCVIKRYENKHYNVHFHIATYTCLLCTLALFDIRSCSSLQNCILPFLHVPTLDLATGCVIDIVQVVYNTALISILT